MSPLGAGERGYPDWQRVSNWDSELLLSDNTAHEGAFAFPVMDVSRYGYLAGKMTFTVSLGPHAVQVTFQWSDTKAFINVVGERNIFLGTNIQTEANTTGSFRILNQGAFVRITVTPEAGAYTWKAAPLIFATNRYSPIEFIPATPLLVATSKKIAAGTSANFVLSQIFSGPVRLIVYNANQPCNIRLQSRLGLGELSSLALTSQAAAGVTSEYPIVLPPTTSRINVENTGGAEVEMSVSVVPSFTGSL